MDGFPFVFFDTGAYLLEGLAHFYVPERAAAYSLFLYYAGARASLWYVAAIQCLIVAFVLTEFARAIAPKTSLWKLLAIGVFLLFFTSVPWFAADIEPDSVTAALAMAVYILAFHARAMGWLRCILLLLVAGFATAVHPSHLGLSAGLAISIAALRIVRFFLPRLPKPNALLPALGFVLGLSLVLAANYSLTHKIFISRSGPDSCSRGWWARASLKQTLDEICPTRHLELCAFRRQAAADRRRLAVGRRQPLQRARPLQGDREGIRHRREREPEAPSPGELRPRPPSGPATIRHDPHRRCIAPQQWVLDPEFRHFLPGQLAQLTMPRASRTIWCGSRR